VGPFSSTQPTEPTELIWTGTRSNLERIPGGGVSLTLGNDVIPVAESVRVLGVVITSDLWLDKHVTAVSAKCFFPASSSLSLARLLRLSSDTGARLRHQSGRLLQLSARWDNEGVVRQATARNECGAASRI